MPEYPLSIVTGASHRLGKAFALALARRGHAVLLHYHLNEQGASETAAELRALQVPVYLQQADLTRAEEIEELFKLVDTLPHPLKVLVNSAAVMKRADARSLSLSEWDMTLDLNLRAPFLCAQAASLRMKEGGLIVNISDVGAQKTWHVYPAYSVSKAALESLTRILARSFAPSIRVNAVAPGLVMHSDVVSEEQWQKMLSRIPLQRAAGVAEVTSALDYLLANEYITGETLVVDGGYSLI
jgi:NAD(P)-dependent dehydrogenase (short-subunit alcohol dehydrogenase family)